MPPPVPRRSPAWGSSRPFSGRGPAVFALTLQLTVSTRGGILSLILFFVLGAAILARIDIARARTAAQSSEARAGLHFQVQPHASTDHSAR